MPLFDEIERTDGAPARRTEDSFRFLNRADGAVWDRIRSQLDNWYAAFPDANGDLRRRFRSRDHRQHYAAWWELYLHGMLTALGYGLTVHPDIPNTKGHPDFLAERADESFYVEGVTVFSGIVSRRPNSPLQASVMDVIDMVDASQFMVGLQFQRFGSSMPKTSDITGPIEAWLSTLDADALLASTEAGVLAERPAERPSFPECSPGVRR